MSTAEREVQPKIVNGSHVTHVVRELKVNPRDVIIEGQYWGVRVKDDTSALQFLSLLTFQLTNFATIRDDSEELDDIFDMIFAARRQQTPNGVLLYFPGYVLGIR